jgi:OFA family oxalate/formate antiporter-like MFS transporter
MTERTTKGRWAVAAAGVLMQVALGGIYAWSVFRNPLMAAFHWSIADVTLAFTLALLSIGFAAYVGGVWTARSGPRAVAITSGVLYGLGHIVASFADHGILFLYFGYGVMAGIGIGFGYIVPVATLVKWFPDRRGLVLGATSGGFGVGALMTSPAAAKLISTVGVLPTFRILGVAYAVATVGAGVFMRLPPGQLAASAPAGTASRPSSPPRGVERRRTPRIQRHYTLGGALRTWQWYALWGLLFLNVTSGISLLSQAAPMAQEVTGASTMVAAGLVGMLAVTNTIGRFAWGSLSDVLGRRWVFFIMFLLQALTLFVLPSVTSFGVFTTLCCLVLFCFGGGFGTMPAFVADYFGSKHVGSIYGLLLTAWGFAGWLGPMVVASMRQSTGRYGPGLRVLAIIVLCAAALPLFGRRPARQTMPDGRSMPPTMPPPPLSTHEE